MVSFTTSIDNSADRDLQRRVVAYLAGRHVPSLRNLQVEVLNGRVTLRGRVRTFYEKQLGQHSARRVAGVVQLVDAIDVAVLHAPAERRGQRYAFGPALADYFASRAGVPSPSAWPTTTTLFPHP